MSPRLFSTGTASTTGGGGGSSGPAFGIIQPDNGTDPTATIVTDTLTVTSPDTSVIVTGSAASNQLQLQVAIGSSAVHGSFSATLPLVYNSANGAYGLGTLNSYGTANYVIGSNGSANGLEYKGITGTAGQIGVTYPAAGAIQIFTTGNPGGGISLGSLGSTFPLLWDKTAGIMGMTFSNANYFLAVNAGASAMEYKGITFVAPMGITFPAAGAAVIYTSLASGISRGSLGSTFPLLYDVSTGNMGMTFSNANYFLAVNAGASAMEYKGVTFIAPLGITFPAAGSAVFYTSLQSGTSLGSFSATLPLVYNAANGAFGLDALNSYGSSNFVLGTKQDQSGLEYKNIVGVSSIVIGFSTAIVQVGILDATSARGGIMTTAGQTLAGAKSFVNTLTMAAPLILQPVGLTDGATITVDGSSGNFYSVTLAGNRSLNAPTNLVNGQKIMFQIGQDSVGSRTLTLDSIYNFGTNITGVTLSTGASTMSYVGTVYRAAKNKLDVIANEWGY